MPLLLACAMLLAQTLGFMHGVTHEFLGSEPKFAEPTARPEGAVRCTAAKLVSDPNNSPGSNVQVTLQSGGEACEPSANWQDKLFSSHHGDNDCRLFDQASHGSAAPQLAALALPVVLPPIAVALFQGEALARWAALFDARGPPLTR